MLKTPKPNVSNVTQQNNMAYENLPFYRQQAWYIVKVRKLLHLKFKSHNRGQNSLEQMSFALKDSFPACKLLPSTANAPLPHCNVGCLRKTYLSTHLCHFHPRSTLQWGGGISTQNFLQRRSVSVHDCSFHEQKHITSHKMNSTWVNGLVFDLFAKKQEI